MHPLPTFKENNCTVQHDALCHFLSYDPIIVGLQEWKWCIFKICWILVQGMNYPVRSFFSELISLDSPIHLPRQFPPVVLNFSSNWLTVLEHWLSFIMVFKIEFFCNVSLGVFFSSTEQYNISMFLNSQYFSPRTRKITDALILYYLTNVWLLFVYI